MEVMKWHNDLDITKCSFPSNIVVNTHRSIRFEIDFQNVSKGHP